MESGLPFKLPGALEDGGNSTPIHIFSGLTNGPLITATIFINNIRTITVIDTGATASFLPRNGKVLLNSKIDMKPSNIILTLGDHGKKSIQHKVILEIRVPKTEFTFTTDLHIINDSDSILGYDALIGMDIIKELNTSITINKRGTNINFGGLNHMHEEDKNILEATALAIHQVETSSIETSQTQHNNDFINRLLTQYSEVFKDGPHKYIASRCEYIFIIITLSHRDSNSTLATKSKISELSSTDFWNWK